MKCKRCGEKFEQKHHNEKYCKECLKLGKDVLSGKVFDYTKPQRCGYCGKEFYGRKKKCCSDECSHQATLQKAREARKYPDYRPPKRPEIKSIKKLCLYCGEEYETSKYTNKRQRFCSPACDAKWRYENPKHSTRKCKCCGKEYIPKAINRTTYCSRECAFEDKRAKPKPKPKPKVRPVCIICGKEFEGCLNAKYCSDGCRKEKANKKSYEYARAQHEQRAKQRRCKECGKLFKPNYGSKKREFCSNICSKKHGRRTGKAVRRARKKKAKYENINPFKIFERDNWSCQICGRKTPRQLRGTYKDKAPELDHIIPLAAGGTHEEKNVQCACRKCNQEKGASAPAQISLMEMV